MSKRKGSSYRSGRSPDWLKTKNPACAAVWLKTKNPACAAVKREEEEDWGKALLEQRQAAARVVLSIGANRQRPRRCVAENLIDPRP